jgi:hypothetical protein
MDHHIVIRNNDGSINNDKATGSRKGGKQKSSSTSYRIPYPDDVLELILDYQVV